MQQFEINVNKKSHQLSCHDDTPLLWVLRDHLHLTGTKYGCGIGQCGACTVYIDGKPSRSCLVTIRELSGKSITTIEGISQGDLHPIQKAWEEVQVPQCGYCQSGQIMTAADLYNRSAQLTDAQIIDVMTPHLCRCGTYPRVLSAIRKATEQKSGI